MEKRSQVEATPHTHQKSKRKKITLRSHHIFLKKKKKIRSHSQYYDTVKKQEATSFNDRPFPIQNWVNCFYHITATSR
uniref:Uncharacterized protein n=1 Tax=Octopus bimaculoides TaxID=37653 RepID=A0A0L8GCV8_OCTBM